jgi:hypothetical protein
VASAPTKSILVKSLCAVVPDAQIRKAKQFLLGLSTDELQYIAEFLGSCILESEEPYGWTRAQVSHGIQRFDQSQKRSVPDRQHKMILLLEYVSRCGMGTATLPSRARLG